MLCMPMSFAILLCTVALDNGIPNSYVAKAAGTSIEMIQKHYYNGNNPQNTERLQQVFTCAAN
jgi:hypothetical protein